MSAIPTGSLEGNSAESLERTSGQLGFKTGGGEIKKTGGGEIEFSLRHIAISLLEMKFASTFQGRASQDACARTLILTHAEKSTACNRQNIPLLYFVGSLIFATSSAVPSGRSSK